VNVSLLHHRGNDVGLPHIQQTFIDTYTRVAFAKLYDCKNALVAADLLNDSVVPFFEEQDLPFLRVLTDRGTEYCGQREHHEYQLYLAVENIDHSQTRAKSPQTNGICERFDRTMQDEFYSVAFRKKLYSSLEQLGLLVGTTHSLSIPIWSVGIAPATVCSGDWKSRRQRVRRPRWRAEEVRVFIRRMKRENPMWGAPRMDGELLLLGFEISEPTVSRYPATAGAHSGRKQS
jgi:hypothetical protein